MNQKVRTFNRWLFLAYVACSLAAIFYLPTLVQTAPAMSASYNFGYNNQVGVVLVLLLVAIGAVWAERSESATMHTRSFSICSSENPYRVPDSSSARLPGYGCICRQARRIW